MGNWLASWLWTSDKRTPLEDPTKTKWENGPQNELDESRVMTQSALVGEDECYIRPTFPYEKWLFVGLPQTGGTGTAKSDSPSGSPSPAIAKRTRFSDEDQRTESINRMLNPMWNEFLLTVEVDDKEIQLHSNNDRILADVTSMVGRTFEALRKKTALFAGCMVHEVGSVGEKTKVGKFEEFDFMIELVALEERVLQEAVEFRQKNDPANTVEVRSSDFPLEYLQSNNIIFSGNNKPPDMFSTLKSVVCKELFTGLLPNWKPGPDLSPVGQSDKGKVRTIRLRWKDPLRQMPLDVFLDFSFCAPFEWSPEKRRLFKRGGSVDDLNPLDQKYHLLIRSDTFWQSTCALREKAILLNSKNSTNARRCYRLAKLLVRGFLPPIYDFKLDTLEGLVPSYWLKQVVLFMIARYPGEESWQDDYIGEKVLEILETLLSCVQARKLDNYFIPGNNHINDNSETEEGNTCLRYLPLVVALIRRTAEGCVSALGDLATLRRLTAEFSKTVLEKARRMRFLLMLLRYKALVKGDRRMLRNTAYFTMITDPALLHSVIKEYTGLHLPNLAIMGEGRNMKIAENGVVMSLDNKISSILADPLTFPDDWIGLYTKLCTERIPNGSLYFGQWEQYLLPRLGYIVRKIFCGKGETPSMSDEVYLTFQFQLF